jgi:hypothetical protein
MRRALVVLGVVVLAACQDQGPRHNTVPLSSTVGVQVTNPYFQWQSPVPPGSQPGTGAFYSTLAPVVTICKVLDNGGCPGVSWSANGATAAPSAVAVSNPLTEQYEVQWSNVQSHDRGLHTISVHVDGKLLGEVTVNLTDGGGSGLNVSGNALPIKFRIEVGALCYGVEGCGEEAIGPSGGYLILDNSEENFGTGGLYIPPNAVTGLVVFKMNRYTGPDACLPLTAGNGALLDGQDAYQNGRRFIQYEACYTLETEPEVTTFAQAVEIGMCLDQYAFGDGTRLDQLEAIKGRETNGTVDQTSLVTLEDAPESDNPWMLCPDPWEIAFLEGGARRLERLASSNWVPGRIASLLLPKPAYAMKRRNTTGPYTKLAREFSRVAPVRPVYVTYENVDMTGLPGALVQPKPTVIVRSAVTSRPVANLGVMDVPVAWTPMPPGSSSVEGSPRTGGDGKATADWMLGATTGPYSLKATVGYFGASYGGFPNIDDALATRTFTAFASTYHAYLQSPLGDGTSGTGNLTTVATRVFVCGPLAAVGAACTGNGSTQAPLDAPKLDNTGAFWQTAWKPGKNVPNGLYRIEVRLLDGSRIGQHYGRRGSGGGTDVEGIRQFNSDSNVPVKYTVSQ